MRLSSLAVLVLVCLCFGLACGVEHAKVSAGCLNSVTFMQQAAGLHRAHHARRVNHQRAHSPHISLVATEDKTHTAHGQRHEHAKEKHAAANTGKDIWDDIKKDAQDVGNAAGKMVDDVETAAKQEVNAAVETVKQDVQGAVDTVQKDVQAVETRVEGAVQGAVDTVKQDVAAVEKGVTDTAHAVEQGVRQEVAAVQGAVDTVEKGVVDTAHAVEQGVVDTAHAVEKEVKEEVATVQKDVGVVVDYAKKEGEAAVDTVVKTTVAVGKQVDQEIHDGLQAVHDLEQHVQQGAIEVVHKVETEGAAVINAAEKEVDHVERQIEGAVDTVAAVPAQVGAEVHQLGVDAQDYAKKEVAAAVAAGKKEADAAIDAAHRGLQDLKEHIDNIDPATVVN